MSYVARLALLVLVACASPQPPAVEEPAAVEAHGPSAPELSPGAPAAPDSPAASAELAATPPASASELADAPVVETLFVRATLADCQAEGARQCLQVRSSEQEDWRNFFGAIEGFSYEPAHAYELRVEVSPVLTPPADAPSLRYRLLEVVSKRKPGKGQAE